MSDIQLTLYPPNTQIIDVHPSQTVVLSIANDANIYASEIMEKANMDGSSVGDFTPRTANQATPGGFFTHPEWFDYTSGSLVVTTDGVTDDFWWLATYPQGDINTIQNDIVLSWSGKINVFPINSAYCTIGLCADHHGSGWDSIYDTLEKLIGFRTSETANTWIASVWRQDDPDYTFGLYNESFNYDTGVSIYDEVDLRVVVCDNGTKALFYVNGSLVATTEGTLPISGIDQNDTAFAGVHVRHFGQSIPTASSAVKTNSLEVIKCIANSSVTVGARLISKESLDSVNVSDLGDVAIATLVGNDILTYNAGTDKWVNISRTSWMSGYTSLLSTIYPTTPQQATSRLIWWNANSGTTRTLIPSATGLTTLTLDEAANTMVINTPTAVSGDLSGNLPSPTVVALQGVGVQSGTPSDQDVMIYSASPAKWQHQSYATAGISAVGHTHAASDVTSGTFAIARIPTGTTSTTVSLGNHTHYVTDLAPKASPTTTWATKAPVWNDSTKTWDPTTIPTVPTTLPPSDGNYGDVTVSGTGTVMRINGGIHQYARVGPLSGRDYTAMINAPATSATGAPSTSTWYMVPFVCPQDMTATAMKMNVTTGVASSSVYLAIYASNTDTGYPTGAPLVSSSTSLATTATPSNPSSTISLAMTENTQYWLWFGTGTTAASTFRSASNSAFPSLGTLISTASVNYNCLSGGWTPGTGNYPNFTTTAITTSNLLSVSPLPLVAVSIA